MLIAWGAAAAFVVSLIYLAYFYLHTLASTAGNPADRAEHLAINTGLFAVFALHHSVFARSSVKRAVVTMIPAHLERSVYVWVASLAAIGMCLLWQPVAGLVYAADGLLRAGLWTLQAAGAVVALRAARVINAFELAGIDQAAGRAPSGELKIVGPFRRVRHPIYLGWILMVFATPTMTANRLAFATISTLYLILAIPWEERSLAVAHGDRYREYREQVRWRLIPGVW